MKRGCFSFIFFLIFFIGDCYAQYFPAKDYPQNYFTYPVINVRKSLSANFGELRPNHYHMGLDCRTDQAQNKTVVASADGYVARISVAPWGYGRAIYINHPNGFTTVYGHLNRFFPELQKYLEEQQYHLESWAVDLTLEPDQFPVKKGQYIALSGNTGGSFGPHVHFEIRDTKTEKVLNPLLFNMPIPDRVPPTIVGLYMFDRNKSTYSQSPKMIPMRFSGGRFVATQSVIIVPEKVSFGITANDKQSGSANPNGIYEGRTFLDNQILSGFQLDSIDYIETRYINAHIDYKTKAAGGRYIQHFSRLPGYPIGVYYDFDGDGVIHLADNNIHQVRLEVLDADGNKSSIELNIRRGITNNLDENTNIDRAETEFMPNFVNIYEDSNLQLYLDDKALYDSVRFTTSMRSSDFSNAVSQVHRVLSGLVPSQTYFTIRIKANKNINDTNKVLMKRMWGTKSDVVKAVKEGDWWEAKFRDFGDFVLLTDETAPVIQGGFANNANLSGRTSITFTPKDNEDEITNFRAELDGQWLMFSNDKGANFTYIFDEHCPRGSGHHTLKISAEDLVGNKTERILNFTR